MPDQPEPAVREAILAAFAQLRPSMIEDVRSDADLDPGSSVPDYSDTDLHQFVNAWEALFREALEGPGRETRELIFDTALPPIVAAGRTAQDMVRTNMCSAVMLAHRLLPLVAPEHRDAAARWLASFQGEYAHDLLGRVLAIERGER